MGAPAAAVIALIALVRLLATLSTGRFAGGLGDSDQVPTVSWEHVTQPNFVTSLALDPSSGRLWAGTEGGLMTWNPGRGALELLTASDGLCANAVFDVQVDRSGRPWATSVGGGLCRREPDGSWTDVNSTTGLPYGSENIVIAVATDADYTWIIAEDEEAQSLLVEVDAMGEPRSRGPVPDSMAGADSLIAGQGTVWIADRGAVARRDADGRWRTWTVENGLPALDGTTRKLVLDAQGQVWLGGGDTVARLDRSETWQIVDGLTGAWLMAADPDGSMWFAAYTARPGVDDTYEFLVKRRSPDGRVETYQLEDPLLDKPDYHEYSFIDMVADGRGGLWLGTDGLGLLHVDSDGVGENLRMPAGLLDPWPGAIALGPDGSLWTAHSSTYFSGLSRRDASGDWQTFPLPEDLVIIPQMPDGLRGAYRQLSDLAIDGQGAAWVAANGILRLGTDRRWSLVEPTVGPWNLEIGALVVVLAPDGSLWFGGRDNVAIRRPDGSWAHVGREEGLPGGSVVAISFASDGRAWILTWEGICQMDAGGRCTVLPEGWLGDRAYSPSGLSVDAGGNGWFSAAGTLGRIDPSGAVERFEHILDHPIHYNGTVLAGAAGEAWFSATRAIETGSELDRLLWPYDGGLLHHAPDGAWTVYSAWDGLGGASVVDLTRDPASGDLWIALDSGGLARLSMRGAARPTTPPGMDFLAILPRLDR